MKVTTKDVAQRLRDYLYHQITVEELVDWAELMMGGAEFDETELEIIKEIIGRLGLADVRAFGITWEDCEEFLRRLGWQAEVIIQERLVAA